MNKILKSNGDKRTLRHVRRPRIRQTVEQNKKKTNKQTHKRTFSNTEFTVPVTYSRENWQDARPKCHMQ